MYWVLLPTCLFKGFWKWNIKILEGHDQSKVIITHIEIMLKFTKYIKTMSHCGYVLQKILCAISSCIYLVAIVLSGVIADF